MIGIVVIAASAGGLVPLRQIIATLPVPCSAAVFVVMHIGPHPSMLPGLLSSSGLWSASFARDGVLIEAGHVYVAPPDHHMVLEHDRIRLNQGLKVHHTRPAADPLFISAAEAHGPLVMGIVLSGGDRDGAAGVQAIAKHGGTALVQDPAEAETPSMPRSAVMADHPAGRSGRRLLPRGRDERVERKQECKAIRGITKSLRETGASHEFLLELSDSGAVLVLTLTTRV